MFEQTFKSLDDILRKEAGCASELDYTEQTSWLLFLKYLDDLETARATDAELRGQAYTPIIDAAHRWGRWAAPKDAAGKLDHNRAKTGPDLIAYVNRELFPHLEGFKGRATSADTIEYKIGEIFSEIRNKFQSGYSLRDAIDAIDALSFGSQIQKHELSELYEAKIKNMGNAGRNGGEYYTPRPLIRAMIKVLKPTLYDTVYDGAAGSCGFLCEAYDYLRPLAKTTADRERLQKRTFFAKEKKSLAYVIGTMNMILHGIEAPNIVHTNTLAEPVLDIQEKDRFDVILANPPFGGKERPEIQQNFPIKTGETAYLFLQHFIKSLRGGGSAAVVIKNTFLSNTDSASVALRRELLDNCNLHTVLDMPGGTFQGAGVKTVVLFFAKGEPTRNIWYYRLDPGRNIGKTNPLKDSDMADFIERQASFADGPNAWSVAADAIDPATFDLTVRNPNAPEAKALHNSQEMLDGIVQLDRESADLLARLKLLLESRSDGNAASKLVRIRDCATVISGQHIDAKDYNTTGDGIGYLTGPSDFGETFPLVSKWTRVPKRTALPGDILITVKGSGVGSINMMAATEVAISRQLMAIRSDHYPAELLYLSLEMAFEHFQGLANGAAIPGISRADVLDFELTVPDDDEIEPFLERMNKIRESTAALKRNAETKLAMLSALNGAFHRSLMCEQIATAAEPIAA
jgi:type I restriction enzyme M protein